MRSIDLKFISKIYLEYNVKALLSFSSYALYVIVVNIQDFISFFIIFFFFNIYQLLLSFSISQKIYSLLIIFSINL